MKLDKRIIFWALIYFVFVNSAFGESVIKGNGDFSFFIYGNLFNFQRYLWVVSSFFLTYLYLLKKPFTSPIFVARCKKTYFRHIIIYGLKICATYMLYTLILFLGVPFLYQLPLEFDLNFLREIINLFAFIFTDYLFYIWMLLKTNQQMLSILSVLIVNLVILVVVFATGVIGMDLFRLIFMPISIFMIFLNIWQYRGKEIFI